MDGLIQQFMEITGSSHKQAVEHLNKNENDLSTAVQSYYLNNDDDGDNDNDNDEGAGVSSTLSQSAKDKKTSDNKFKSFSQLMKESAGDNDGLGEDSENRNTFAGGETSGLEISDPNKDKKNISTSNSLIRDLLEKAKRGGELPPGYDDDDDDEEEGDDEGKGHNGGKKLFLGKGSRLGSTTDEQHTEEAIGEEHPSILSQLSSQQQKPKRVSREITFWKEGFQVGTEGELYRYDDPKNEFYLKELNQGRAPLKLLDVEFGQEVDVNVYRKLDESFKAPKRKLGGFQGQGQRLGAPIPGESYLNEQLQKEQVQEQKQEVVEKSVQDDDKNIEEKGDTQIQIRLTNGKREIYRCFSTDLLESVYAFVKSKTENQSKPFTINHAFPVKPIFDLKKTVKEEGLCNATIIQRWV